jgi:hypothetical protein
MPRTGSSSARRLPAGAQPQLRLLRSYACALGSIELRLLLQL